MHSNVIILHQCPVSIHSLSLSINHSRPYICCPTSLISEPFSTPTQEHTHTHTLRTIYSALSKHTFSSRLVPKTYIRGPLYLLCSTYNCEEPRVSSRTTTRQSQNNLDPFTYLQTESICPTPLQQFHRAPTICMDGSNSNSALYLLSHGCPKFPKSSSNCQPYHRESILKASRDSFS